MLEELKMDEFIECLENIIPGNAFEFYLSSDKDAISYFVAYLDMFETDTYYINCYGGGCAIILDRNEDIKEQLQQQLDIFIDFTGSFYIERKLNFSERVAKVLPLFKKAVS